MKTIIAGTRHGITLDDVSQAVKLAGYSITEVVSGRCGTGADRAGEVWAKQHGLPIQPFPAMWEDLDARPCAIRTRADGSKYNSLAGHNRNEEMAQYADALIAVWDGKSTGTQDMIRRAIAHGLRVFVWTKGKAT